MAHSGKHLSCMLEDLNWTPKTSMKILNVVVIILTPGRQK